MIANSIVQVDPNNQTITTLTVLSAIDCMAIVPGPYKFEFEPNTIDMPVPKLFLSSPKTTERLILIGPHEIFPGVFIFIDPDASTIPTNNAFIVTDNGKPFLGSSYFISFDDYDPIDSLQIRPHIVFCSKNESDDLRHHSN